MSYVIRDPSTGLYAQPWYRCEPGQPEQLLRIDWVEKESASSYQKRSQARDVLDRFPQAQWEAR